MSRTVRDVAAATAALLLLASGTANLAAQEWRLGTQYGRLSYPGAAAATVEQSSVALTLTRAGFDQWLALSVATPLQGDAHWAAAAAARRFTFGSRAGGGLDLSGHAFLQRVQVDLPGSPLPPIRPPRSESRVLGGGGAMAMLLGYARLGDVRLEARGGAAAHALSGAGLDGHEVLPVADVRLSVALGPALLAPEAQHWHQRATYLGATARTSPGRVDAWAGVGTWTHGGPTTPTWGAGAGLALPGGLRIEASYRRTAFDPLYGTTTGSAASVGASVRIGGSTGPAPPVPAAYVDGHAVIRLAARDARGTPRIAGDFTNWTPVAMTPSQSGWSVTVPLEPGVYHYAFVTEDGEWFVPPSTPGRRDDGMGGWVAVLVVQP